MIQLCKECLHRLATLPGLVMLALALVGAGIITALTLPHQSGGFRSSSGAMATSTSPIQDTTGAKDTSRAGPMPPQADDGPPVGRSFVIDDPVARGDSSIRFKDQSVFLSEIERFTSKDICTRASGARWACGLHAYATLQNSIAKKQIRCVERMVTGSEIEASCECEDKNVALLLVEKGLARLRGDVQDRELIAAQEAAQAQHLGIWDR